MCAATTAAIVRVGLVTEAAGVQVSGSGITLNAALTKAHQSGTQIAENTPTPGAPNQYARKFQ